MRLGKDRVKIRFCLFFLLLMCNCLYSFADVNSIGALGDSISTGFNSGGWGDKGKQYSWSTGNSTSIESHYTKLTEYFDHNIMVHNFAVAGAVAADLTSQVDKLLVEKPDYVTVLIGANDVCSWGDDYASDLDKFKNYFSTNVIRIIEHNPQVKLLIVPIPNLVRLWEVGKESSSCKFKWRLFGICQPLLGRGVTDYQRQLFNERIEQISQFYAEFAALYPANIIYDASLVTYLFDIKHISKRDCFHPSLAGQDLISQLTWSNGWFIDNSSDLLPTM